MPPAVSPSVDVAVNIFAKPHQTALSLLSLLRACEQHVGVIYLQFEPYGSQHDQISPYLVAAWLQERLGPERCRVFQPDHWLDLKAPDMSRLTEDAYRWGIRYQYAFEHSSAPLLFLMHNDIFVQRDILGAMLAARGEAFAVGMLGQCWNCPAADAPLMRDLFALPPCRPGKHESFRPSFEELRQLYTQAHARGIFARPYDEGFTGIFDRQPWPLPECRINEWACLIDLERTRPLTLPFGSARPPGAYRDCGPVCLDIGVEWFRAMHAHGLHARHFPVFQYLKHWVGTGKVTRRRYLLAEDNALSLLKKHFPAYVDWLRRKSGVTL